MSREQASKKEQLVIFAERARGCRTDNQKIKFFDSSQEAFFTDSNETTISVNGQIPKDLDDAFYVYANMKKLNERELMELKGLEWTEYPDILKIFLFDFCILNGSAYSAYFSAKKLVN